MKTLFLTLGRIAGVISAWLKSYWTKRPTAAEPTFDEALEEALRQLRSIFAITRVQDPLNDAGLPSNTVWVIFEEVEKLIIDDFRRHPDWRKPQIVTNIILYHLQTKALSLMATREQERKACGQCMSVARRIWKERCRSRSFRQMLAI